MAADELRTIWQVKPPEAEGEKRFNHYDDNRGIISGGEGTRGGEAHSMW